MSGDPFYFGPEEPPEGAEPEYEREPRDIDPDAQGVMRGTIAIPPLPELAPGPAADYLDALEAWAVGELEARGFGGAKPECKVFEALQGEGRVSWRDLDLARLRACIAQARFELRLLGLPHRPEQADEVMLFFARLGAYRERIKNRQREPEVVAALNSRQGLAKNWADPQADRLLLKRYDAAPRGEKQLIASAKKIARIRKRLA